MAIDQRCILCFEKTFERLMRKYSLSEDQKAEFTRFYRMIMADTQDLITPEIQRLLQHKLGDLSGIYDPFQQEKLQSNQIALQLYNEWKPKVLADKNPYLLALRLSIAGNIMDYAVHNDFNINETIRQVLVTDFTINHSKLLKDCINKSENILFLGDNAGEIVFDKLFIETMMHPDVTYVVRGGPAINDATLEDAEMVGMEVVADVVSNGFDAASTILKRTDARFNSLYKKANLIISKGQGNLEGLLHEHDPRIFFLLMVKCNVIAEELKVDKGSIVVLNKYKKISVLG